MKNRLWLHLLFAFVILLHSKCASSMVTPEEWRDFKLKYGKNYQTRELDEMHLRNYERSKVECEKNNQLYEKGQVKFQMAINEYSDIKPDKENIQFLADHNPDKNEESVVNFRSGIMRDSRPKGYKTYNEIVEEKIGRDWRHLGIVSPVGNQKDCNSCWAFSSTGALEAQMRIKNHEMVNLSPKNLLDCSIQNRGCYGGWVRRAYDHIIATGGIATKESYPYKPINETCKYSAKQSAGTMSSMETLKSGNETLMAEIVYNIGPVTASIDFNHESFSNYKKGIYAESKCKNDKLHLAHSILVVGFGIDVIDGDYWIIKNSYGNDWGMDGYMLMARNRNNMCGIATLAQYPVI